MEDNHMSNPAAKKKSLKPHWLPIAALILGLLSVALIAFTHRKSVQQEQNVLMMDAVHELQIELTLSHLWLEEYVNGDRDIDMKQVWTSVDLAIKFSDAMLHGGMTPHGYALSPLSDASLRKNLVQIRSSLSEYQEMALDRFRENSGSVADAGLDLKHKHIMAIALFLDEKFEKIEAEYNAESERLFIAIIMTWSSIVAVAVVSLWKRELQRKKSEAVIVQAKKEWEETFDAMPDLIAIIDREHRIVRANRAMSEKMGIAAGDIIGKKCHEVFHRSGMPIATCPHSRMLADNREHTVEYYEESLNAYYLISVSPLFDPEGEVVCSVHIARDITAQKRAAGAMKIKDSAIESSINAIAIGDLSGTITYANPAFLRMWGYAGEEILGRSGLELGRSPEEVAKVIDALRDQGTWTGEMEARKKDGTIFTIEISANMVQDETAKPLCLMASIIDITKRKRAEEELKMYRDGLEQLVETRTIELTSAVTLLHAEVAKHQRTGAALQQSEEKFRRLSQEFNILLDAIPDSLVLMTPDLRIKWANRSALTMLGREGMEVVGNYCYAIWHDQDRPCDECPVLKSYDSGIFESSEISTPDGRLFAVRAYPIRNEQGGVESVIEISTDITEKANLQAEQMRSNHLASIGELAAGVAHEVNNPINGIINYAQILMNRAEAGSSDHDVAERIIREGDRIAVIVKSLLSFARERKEEKMPIQLGQVLSVALGLTEMQLRKNDIDLSVEVPPDLPLIMAHAQQLQQVFLNIINNARYALNMRYPGSDPDKIFLIRGSRIWRNSSEQVCMVFEDHGSGMPKHIIEKVMSPFFTTKPVGVGTGLGLSISHGIIVDHHGTITIESREKEYTRVIITLPAYEAAA